MNRVTLALLSLLLANGCEKRETPGAAVASAETAASAASEDAGALRFDAAWVREPVAGRRLTAAYARITNTTSQPVIISSVSTPSARVIEMHEMSMNDGIMRMKKLDAITIPPDGVVTLEPGGLHLMVIDLISDPRAGEKLRLEAESDAGRFTFDAVVSAQPPEAPGAQPHH